MQRAEQRLDAASRLRRQQKHFFFAGLLQFLLLFGLSRGIQRIAFAEARISGFSAKRGR